MSAKESFSDLIYADELHAAEGELSAFIVAVTQLFGPDQARVSADDWLDEAELMDSPPRSTTRCWRAVTVAASARLANRLTVEVHRRPTLIAPTDTTASPTPVELEFIFEVTAQRPGN